MISYETDKDNCIIAWLSKASALKFDPFWILIRSIRRALLAQLEILTTSSYFDKDGPFRNFMNSGHF